MFSNFDEYGNAESLIMKGANYKPLVEKLEQLNHKILWLLPIVKNKHKIYDIPAEEIEDTLETTMAVTREEENELFQQYKTNTIPDGQNKYNYLLNKLNYYFTIL